MTDRKNGIQVTALLSVLHMAVDFLCGAALYAGAAAGRVSMPAFLLYNFCAFALQMPFGVLIDAMTSQNEKPDLPGRIAVAAGVVLTVAGVFAGPLVLGLGNALFHVGGGVLTIRQDDHCGFKGRALGVFVAPGAIGLAAGTLLGQMQAERMYVLAVTVVSALLCVLFFRTKEAAERQEMKLPDISVLPGALILSLVVVIRSMAGLAMKFSWKSGVLMIMLSAVAAAGGKAAGGFLAAKLNMRRAAVLSLLLAAECFYESSAAAAGLLGLFLFNMSMPMTLYGLKRRMPSMPGFAFGILTFALFIGYLLAYIPALSAVDSSLMGIIASLLSMAMLAVVLREE